MNPAVSGAQQPARGIATGAGGGNATRAGGNATGAGGVPPSRLPFLRPVYVVALFQLLFALTIGVVGMLAASKTCYLSITWVYFFNAIWNIVNSSVGLAPTRRATFTCTLAFMIKTMRWYRSMCGVGIVLLSALMTLDLVGLLNEQQNKGGIPSSDYSICITMHISLLSIAFVAILVCLVGIAVSWRALLSLSRLDSSEDDADGRPQAISASVGHINLAMMPDIPGYSPADLPAYSVDADLPPTYEDVLSGKADETGNSQSSLSPDQIIDDT